MPTATRPVQNGDVFIPKGEKFEFSNALRIVDTSSPKVYGVCPFSGGFVRKISREALAKKFEYVPEAQRDCPYSEGRFDFGEKKGEPSFKGYSRGELWNGWEMPCFEKPVAEEILKAFERGWASKYDEATDSFYYWSPDNGEIEAEAEPVQGFWIEVSGEKKKVYGIGAGCWTWVRLNDEDDEDNH